ncbi:MAG: GNAT family N-acetyltransferase [Tissierellia bacterium]|nr:GNAT family N-acetyltransferase [Tissierellia bacterium]
MEIRQLEGGDYKRYREITYRGYPALRDFSSKGIKDYEENLITMLNHQDEVRFFGAFIEEELVAVMRLFTIKMNIFGKLQTVSGLGFLATDPLFKNQGIGRKMVEFFEKDALDHGIFLGILLPFRPDFYGKVGYGILSKLHRYEIGIEYLPNKPKEVLLKEVKDFHEIFSFQKRMATNHHGHTILLESEKEEIKEDLETYTIGAYNKECIGYLRYRTRPLFLGNYTRNYFQIEDLVTESPKGLEALLSHLKDQKDQGEYILWDTHREGVEHFFEHPLDRSGNYIPRGYLQSNISAVGLMGKILNYDDFLEAYPSFSSLKTFTWKMDYKTFGHGEEIMIKEKHLAPLWLGTISPRALYELGLISCKENVLETLENILPRVRPLLTNLDL